MTICRVAALFPFFISTVIGCFPLKITFLEMAGNDKNLTNILISLGICFGAAFIGWVYPKVTNVFALAGTFTCSICGAIVPIYMGLKIGYVEVYHKKLLLNLLLIFIIGITCSSMFVLVTDLFK